MNKERTFCGWTKEEIYEAENSDDPRGYYIPTEVLIAFQNDDADGEE